MLDIHYWIAGKESFDFLMLAFLRDESLAIK